ncbi:hypothetical protein [Gynurincola endophyticus]|uniref:hypothetical protein n=1 Tax=Gynurincola endophyticus TaxID=2479004 RepID=UPI000F8CBA20|nr:hypothetical protein [Gynurincola endophyticus]
MFNRNLSQPWLLFAMFAVLVSTSCKKSKGEQEEETPVLGSCKTVSTGPGLSKLSEQVYVYESVAGVTIRIERKSPESLIIKLRDNAYSNFEFEFWGDGEPGQLSPASHENLNGKHIKDRFGKNRTVIFRDGTKMTYASPAPWYFGGVTAISIYDADIVHHFNMTCFSLEYSTVNGLAAKNLEAEQPDGETSTYDITESGLLFYNIYTEETPGNKVEKIEKLGSLENANPNLVNDFFNDPRLSYT